MVSSQFFYVKSPSTFQTSISLLLIKSLSDGSLMCLYYADLD
jgi:hypothetical protein